MKKIIIFVLAISFFMATKVNALVGDWYFESVGNQTGINSIQSLNLMQESTHGPFATQADCYRISYQVTHPTTGSSTIINSECWESQEEALKVTTPPVGGSSDWHFTVYSVNSSVDVGPLFSKADCSRIASEVIAAMPIGHLSICWESSTALSRKHRSILDRLH